MTTRQVSPIRFPDSIGRIRSFLIGQGIVTVQQISQTLPGGTLPAGAYVTIPVSTARRQDLVTRDTVTVIECRHASTMKAAQLADDIDAALKAWATSDDPAAPWAYDLLSLDSTSTDPDTGTPRAVINASIKWAATA